MTLDEVDLNQIYRVVDVPPNDPCENCKYCSRLRMMEVGFNPGQRIVPVFHHLGIVVVKVEGSSSAIALREEEAKRIIVEKSSKLL